MDSTSTQQRHALIGNSIDFWRYSATAGFDLTRTSPTSGTQEPKVTFQATTAPITVATGKTALIIIDMQNFFLSESLGRKRGPGHDACDQLIRSAIPAARRAKIQIIWLNWGLNDDEVADMPPAVQKVFGADLYRGEVTQAEDDSFNANSTLRKGGEGATRSRRIYKGLGSHCGPVTLPSGETVDAGRLLMRDSWNTELYPPLDAIYEEGVATADPPDIWIDKNRMSGMWGSKTACEEFLEERGIRTLLFAGVNTDQCVAGTLTDAFNKGYDCVLLSDGCGTTSPDFSQHCIELNSAKSWGFCSTCEDFALGVAAMA